MQVTGTLLIFVFGCLGGALLELLRWWKIRESPNFPAYAHRPVYWFLTIAMIVAGGVVAAVYGAGPVSAIQAMNLGAAAPAIIGALAAQPRDSDQSTRRNLDGTQPENNRARAFLSFG